MTTISGAIDQFAEANVDLLAKFVKPISNCVVSGYTDIKKPLVRAWGSSS